MVSSSIFKVFGMTRPGIEPRSPGPLANTLTAGPFILFSYTCYICVCFPANGAHNETWIHCCFQFEYIYIYIYIYIYRILSPVKPELGVIPSGQENIREYLDLPGKELNVSIIQSNNFIKKKTTKPITKDYKFISILLRIFEIFKNTKKN